MDATDIYAAAVTVTIVSGSGVVATAPGFTAKPTRKPAAKEAVTDSLFAAYKAMYDHFNQALFGGKLLPVVLNFSRHANSRGFFAPERWEAGDAVTHEISLNPTYLMSCGARETASTLVHEMVHCWQQEHGTPGRKGYHNEQWAKKMDEVGLAPSHTGAPGGKRTGYQMTHYIVEGGAFAEAFEAMPKGCRLPWLCSERKGIVEGAAGTDDDGAEPKKPSSKVKFTCPTCRCNAWGKPSLKLICGECEEDMEAEEGGES